VPPYKLGLQTNVTFSNAAQLNQDYYSQCLQKPIFDMQDLLRHGLGLPSDYRVWLDLDDLLIMDPLGRAEVDAKEITAGIQAPDDARARRNLPPVPGGKYPLMQQQNYSLPALAKRDAQDDPFAKATPSAPAAPEQPTQEQEDAAEKLAFDAIVKAATITLATRTPNV
jgi:hypothetical protein